MATPGMTKTPNPRRYPESATMAATISGPDHRPGLVEGLVQGEGPAAAGLAAGLGEHGVPRRGPHSLAEAFRDDQQRGLPQHLGQRQQRDRDHGHQVAGD